MPMQIKNIINSRNKKLVWNLLEAESDAIIVMCHWFLNDKRSQWRFEKIWKTLNEAGFNVLSFDFAWCWESEDEPLLLENMIDDLKCVLKYVKSRWFKNIWLLGHSLGSLVSLFCYTEDIITLVLIWALTDALEYNMNKNFSKDQLNELEIKWYITQKVRQPWRSEVIIDKTLFTDIMQIDQEKLLSKIKSPVLIIHWNDFHETELYNKTKKGFKFLPSESRLEILDWADHLFFNHFEELSALSKDWFEKYISK